MAVSFLDLNAIPPLSRASRGPRTAAVACGQTFCHAGCARAEHAALSLSEGAVSWRLSSLPGRLVPVAVAAVLTARKRSRAKRLAAYEDSPELGASGLREDSQNFPLRLAGAAAAAVVLAATFCCRGGTQQLLAGSIQALAAIEGLGYTGVVAYLVTFVLATQLLIPSTPLEMAAGVLFAKSLGLTRALVIAAAGKQLSGYFGFFLGRTLLRRPVEEQLLYRFEAFRSARRLVAQRPLAVAFAIRGAPIPTALKSIGTAACGVPFGRFALAAVLSGTPWSALCVAAGSTLASLPELLDGSGATRLQVVLRSLPLRRLRVVAACVLLLGLAVMAVAARLRRPPHTGAAKIVRIGACVTEPCAVDADAGAGADTASTIRVAGDSSAQADAGGTSER